MTQFLVTLKSNSNGQLWNGEIPASDIGDARDYTERVLCKTYQGWDVVRLVEKPQPKPACHYCGSPAVSGAGFFGEPVCRQCGG